MRANRSHKGWLMFGKGIAVQGSEWEAKTEELASRGISLSDLVGFYSNLGDSIMKSFQPAVHTTNDVVRLGIIPQTSMTCSSYVQLVNDGKKARICPEGSFCHFVSEELSLFKASVSFLLNAFVHVCSIANQIHD